VLKVQLRIKT